MLAFFPVFVITLPAWAVHVLAFVVPVAYAAAFAYAAGRILAKKPGGSAPGVGELLAPTCSARPYPIILGTPPVDPAPNVLSWWGKAYYPIRHKSTTVGSYIRIQCHLGLWQRGIDGVLQAYCNGVCVWPTVKDETDFAAEGLTTMNIAAGNVFGGPLAGGGIDTNMTIEYGDDAQTQNAELVAEYGADVPAHRGFVGALGMVAWTNNAQIPQIAMLAKATKKMPDGTDIWYVAKATIGTLDANPAHMIYKLLTIDKWDGGEGMTAEDFDEDTWTAAADTLYDEGLGLSAIVTPEGEAVQDVIDQILIVISGVIRRDHATGKLQLKLIRDDYEIDELPIFDANDVTAISNFQRPSPYAIPSRTLVNWSNRLHPAAAPAPGQYNDSTLITMQGGRVNEQVWNMPLICDADVANAVAGRLGRQSGAMGVPMTLTCKRTMSHLRAGDAFRLSFAHPNLTITQMVVRVGEVNLGSLAAPAVTIKVSEDVFATGYTVMGAPPASAAPPETGFDGEFAIDTIDVSATATVAVTSTVPA